MKVCLICKSEYAGGEVFCPVDGGRLSSPSQMNPQTIDPNDPLIGLSLGGRYRVLRSIGEGGMGIVYEAVHEVIEKKVAIKVLRDDFSKRSEVVERFRQEAKSASRIGHEHIVDISDFGETPRGQSYFVMEYLEGEDLANILAREGTVSAARAVNIILQCCRALGAAHSKGIVHRDMKPENIFLTRRDEQEDFVKIVDFGIAKMSDIETEGAPGRKLTKTGMIFGTPEYMSPEQAAGKPLDHRVDVYALGVILFEMLTGRVPFVGDTFMGILTQHMFESVPPLRGVNPNVQCPPELELVVLKALAKDPEQRYRTMDDLGRGVSAAMDLSGPFTMETAPGYGDPMRTPRRGPRVSASDTMESDSRGRGARMGLAVAGGAVLLIAAGVGGYFAFRAQPTAANGPIEPAVPMIASSPAEVEPIEVAGPEEQAEQEEGSAATAGAAEEPTEAAAEGETPGSPEGEVVAISVTTQPAGARLEVDGRGVVCEATPCTFETARGEGLRLRARRGRLAAVRDVSPTQAMDLEMVMLRRSGSRPSGEGTTGGMSGGGASANDLKVPDWVNPTRR